MQTFKGFLTKPLIKGSRNGLKTAQQMFLLNIQLWFKKKKPKQNDKFHSLA